VWLRLYDREPGEAYCDEKGTSKGKIPTDDKTANPFGLVLFDPRQPSGAGQSIFDNQALLAGGRLFGTVDGTELRCIHPSSETGVSIQLKDGC